jgi:hypothetical protein
VAAVAGLEGEIGRLARAEEDSPSGANALALLGTLLVAFATLALFMTHNHAWTDSVMAALPLPGPSQSLAADPTLSAQVRLVDARAWDTILGDRTSTLIAEASVTNDSLVPIRRVVVEAQARRSGRSLAVVTAICGNAVSHRLLRRLARDELETLRALEAPAGVEPGGRLPCQVSFAGIEPGVEEVQLRIASVEPFPGHHPHAFRPEE